MYSSTSNIEEVMKFYNLGHKTFETDFNINMINWVLVKLLQYKLLISPPYAHQSVIRDLLNCCVYSLVYNSFNMQKSNYTMPP